jgi:hypothetical protein
MCGLTRPLLACIALGVVVCGCDSTLTPKEQALEDRFGKILESEAEFARAANDDARLEASGAAFTEIVLICKDIDGDIESGVRFLHRKIASTQKDKELALRLLNTLLGGGEWTRSATITAQHLSGFAPAALQAAERDELAGKEAIYFLLNGRVPLGSAPELERYLLSLLQKTPEQTIRQGIYGRLAQSDTAESWRALVNGLEEHQILAYCGCVSALAHRGDLRAVAPLMTELKKPPISERFAGDIAALAAYGEKHRAFMRAVARTTPIRSALRDILAGIAPSESKDGAFDWVRWYQDGGTELVNARIEGRARGE